ncbi:MAG: hypothetical protein NC818_03845 [Candidatus Omnitrophica bacterium]|nr:hypothetical protein [Candidatus Omnitrophota bacterium]
MRGNILYLGFLAVVVLAMLEARSLAQETSILKKKKEKENPRDIEPILSSDNNGRQGLDTLFALLQQLQQPKDSDREWQQKSVSLKPEEQISVADLINGLVLSNNRAIIHESNTLVMEYYKSSFSGKSYIYIYIRPPIMETSMVTLVVDANTLKIIEVLAFKPRGIVAVKLDSDPDMPLRDWIWKVLDLPKVTPEMLTRVQLWEDALQRHNAELAEIVPQKDRIRLPMFLPPNGSYVTVLQREAGITSAETNQPYLLTFGAGPCVIVTLYDPNTKIGTLIHFDAISDIRGALGKVIYHMKINGANIERLEARIIGGNTGSSEELIYQIYKALESIGGIQIVEKDILGFESRSIIMDTNTGEIYDLVGTPFVDPLRLQLMAINLSPEVVLVREGLIK